MHIRIATPQDAAALAEMNFEFNDSHATPEHMAAQIEAARGHETPILAEVNDEAAGFACLRVVRCVCYAEPYAEVTEMYVRMTHRRKGVGRALMLFAEQLARDAGAHEVKVMTGFDNAAGQALYGSVGYVADELMMCKQIETAL